MLLHIQSQKQWILYCRDQWFWLCWLCLLWWDSDGVKSHLSLFQSYRRSQKTVARTNSFATSWLRFPSAAPPAGGNCGKTVPGIVGKSLESTGVHHRVGCVCYLWEFLMLEIGHAGVGTHSFWFVFFLAGKGPILEQEYSLSSIFI